MTKITINADCNNSPKKEFLKDFNVAFATGDADFIIDHVSDDIHWVMYGDKELKGKKDFAREINIMKDYVADEMTVHSIVTHGAEAALNGEIKMGGKTYAFCDVYRFSSAGSTTIKELKSYIVTTS
ncbi:SnoaL-like domain-containing protein [Ekhidna lutea]|uniref:SnoaL-like domain-containing protein n=1 Tax=Ekhidna lutea TaxID=447679 RepID=A0A239JWL3_EKHLU|nr:nuclear transport factor 2 family protein [Ekhidna lutea]SNT10281.1 SnoaL-like domain-containing protein [Ekhidna lutea]